MIGDNVKHAIGREPTGVSFVCCNARQSLIVYIGLPGESSRPVMFNVAPTGYIRFPPEIVQLSEAADRALMAAIRKGHSAEDDSNGYALTDDQEARKKELEIRDYALRNEAMVLQVLVSSSDAHHRAIAARTLGYGRQSREQVDALVSACLDPDDEVRNDGTRALGVLTVARQELARRVPAEPFIRLLKSGSWTDRNKASFLLLGLTVQRDPKVLEQLREQALDALIEMARWRDTGHAYTARVLLGRIGGIDEKQLETLAQAGNIDTILAALTPAR